MSEARQRRLQHESSSIFGGDGPPARPQTAAYTQPIPLAKDYNPQEFVPKKEFEPRYNLPDNSLASYRNLYGSDREDLPAEHRQSRQASSNRREVEEPVVGRNRRSQDFQSNVFGRKNPDEFYRPRDIPSECNSPPRQSMTGAEMKRSEQTSSVFGDEASPPKYEGFQGAQKLSEFYKEGEHEVTAKKQQNRQYSNIFGRELGDSPPQPQPKLTASNLKTLDTYGDRGSYRNYDEYSATSFRTEQMRSVLDNEVPEYTRPLPEKPINYDMKVQRTIVPETVTYQVTWLPKYDYEEAIRRKCQGVHIVNLKADANNVTGAGNGTALVTIRGNDERFKLNMAYAGFKVAEYHPIERQATNISAKDSWWQAGDKPNMERDISAESIRSRNISTQDNVFGGSSGVGKWRRTDDPDPQQKEIHAVNHQWRQTKKAVPQQTRYF